MKVPESQSPLQFPTRPVAPQGSNSRGAASGGSLGDALRNLQKYVQGETFAITNLTEEPFEVERTENLIITSRDERHIHGLLKGNGRLKLKGRAVVPLGPNARAEAGK
jgi:hypothetical protein